MTLKPQTQYVIVVKKTSHSFIIKEASLIHIQSNLYLKTTEEKNTIWSLFTGGLYLHIHLCRKWVTGKLKMWLQYTGNCYTKVVCSKGLTVFGLNILVHGISAIIFCMIIHIQYLIQLQASEFSFEKIKKENTISG